MYVCPELEAVCVCMCVTWLWLLGGVSGSVGKVTGVLGDAAAKLSFDKDYQKTRKKASGSVGEGVEGAAKVRGVEGWGTKHMY